MNKLIFSSFMLIVFFLCSSNASSDAEGTIRRNIESGKLAYDRLIDEQAPQLWIHVRTQEQFATTKSREVSAWLDSIKVGGKEVDVRPIQMVDRGPKNTQLRFFFKQNKDEAEQLLKELKKRLPLIQLEDFSGQYEYILEPGHYELWLTPEANLSDQR